MRSSSILGNLRYLARSKVLQAIASTFLLESACLGQGTLTVTFEGQPVGALVSVGIYNEGPMDFSPHGVGSLFQAGGGRAGYPENGTGYLYMGDGYLRVGLAAGFPSMFNLVSFDAAERLAGIGPTTITVIGYKLQIMGPIISVTNVFTTDGVNDGTGPLADFQTFYLDSQFQNVLEVDVLNTRWALDNLVVSGVPEPSAGALAIVGVVCVAGRFKMRRPCRPKLR